MITHSEDQDFDLDETGEFAIPGKTLEFEWREHLQRYLFACRYIDGKTVLDLACGTGYGSDLLARKGAGQVVGGDRSDAAIGYARRHFARHNLSFIRLDAAHLPFSDSQFDIVVSFETLEHLNDQEVFLSECRRVLHENGEVLCSTPMRLTHRPPWAPKPTNPFHTKELTLDGFRDLLLEQFDKIDLFSQSKMALPFVLKAYGVHTLAKGFRRAFSLVPAIREKLRQALPTALGSGFSVLTSGNPDRLELGGIESIRKHFPGFPSVMIAVAIKSKQEGCLR